MTSLYRGARLASLTGHWREWRGIGVRGRKAFLIQVGRWFVLGHCFKIHLSAWMHGIAIQS